MILVLEKEGIVDVLEVQDVHKRNRAGVLYYSLAKNSVIKHHPTDEFFYTDQVTLASCNKIYMLEGGVKHFLWTKPKEKELSLWDKIKRDFG